MTHQTFIKEAVRHYSAVLNDKLCGCIINPKDVFIVWSCKTADNSKLILADKSTSILCEVTLIGSKNLICYDFYKKEIHQEFEVK